MPEVVSPFSTQTFQHEATYSGLAYLQGDQQTFWLDRARKMGIDLATESEDRRRLEHMTAEHLDRMVALMNEQFFPGVVRGFTEQEVVGYFVRELETKLDGNPKLAAIVLDRIIYRALVERVGEKWGARLQHFSLTRPTTNLFTSDTGGKVPRVGDPPLADQARALAEKLQGLRAFMVDDVYVEGGTSRAARATLAEGGVALAPEHEDTFHFRAVRRPDGTWTDANARILALKPPASAEERELTVLGGAHAGASRTNRSGWQTPGFLPFTDGSILRLKNRLDLPDISMELLDEDIRYITAIEGVLGRPVMMEDVQDVLPSDMPTADGERPLVAEFIREYYPSQDPDHLNFVTFLRRTRLTDFLVFARSKVERRERPEKDVVACDMDGVLTELKQLDPSAPKRGFPGSVLEHSVKTNAQRLLAELQDIRLHEAQARLEEISAEFGFVGYLSTNYGPQMIERHGLHATVRIHEIFAECYPPERAAEEAEAFIARMPMEYHVFRTQVWDHDLSSIYEQHAEPAEFAINITQRGGKLIFVTAAPKIHALKMLKFTGIIDAIGVDNFELYTVEDMYEEGTVEDRTFKEGNKGRLLEMISWQIGVPKERIAMGGDQFKSDVRDPIEAGVQSAIINGPKDLLSYARMYRLPRDGSVPVADVPGVFPSEVDSPVTMA